MKKIILFIFVFLSVIGVNAQSFEQYFTDATLRLDYCFIGNADKQSIAVDALYKVPKWYGKRMRLAEVPIGGNGQITVYDKKSNTAIYKHSFSTLFQEWLAFDEAKTQTKSFENVFLIPYPKDEINVLVELKNSRGEVTTSLRHTINPKDILIRKIGDKDITPYTTIQKAQDTTKCVRIAFIAEGYTAEEMPKFIAHCNTATKALFGHEPFKSMQNRFNIVAVKAESKESGTSIPSKGIWKNTALLSNFDTFYSSRYLTTLHLKRLHDLLTGIPYEHIIVLVNTETYGGGGILNSYNLSMTNHRMFEPVVVHEFGHSFAGLGDEYAYGTEELNVYPTDIEPWEANLTTLVDFESKWADMVDSATHIPTPHPLNLDKENAKNAAEKWKVGAYQPAGYSQKGVYRPFPDCRMRTNENPEFCPVCRRAIRRVIQFYTE